MNEVINRVTLREFSINTYKYLQDIESLPIVITKRGRDFVRIADVATVGDVATSVATKYKVNVATKEGVATQKPVNVATKKAHNVPEERASLVEEGFISHKCDWDKGFHCPSPGVIQKGNKWYCMPHLKLILKENEKAKKKTNI